MLESPEHSRIFSLPQLFGSQNFFLNKINCNTTDFDIYRYKPQNVVRQLYNLFSTDNRVAPNFFVEKKILVTKKLLFGKQFGGKAIAGWK